MNGNAQLKAALEAKERRATEVIARAYKQYENNCAVVFSGTKESTVLLHCVRAAFGGRITWKVLTIETGAEFAVVKSFVRGMAIEWDFQPVVLENKNRGAEQTPWASKDKAECCRLLKTAPLLAAMAESGYGAVLMADSHHGWELGDEDFIRAQNGGHAVVRPLLHFAEIDIWSYIKKYSLPFCGLYKKGYRKIDCMPCTAGPGVPGERRSGTERERQAIASRLKSMGYF